MSIYNEKLVNRLTPDQQISNLLLYKDTVSEAEKALVAEKVGLSISGAAGTNGTDGTTLNDFVDATYGAFSVADAQRWIHISGSSNGNDGWYYIESYVSATQVKFASALAAEETGLVWQMYHEPNLQDDLNVTITQLREIIDPSSDWFQNMPRAFDPTNTDGSNTKNEKMSLKVLADNWYGTHTKIIDIATTAQSASPADDGILFLTSLGYADATDRRGLVIQASTGNAYYDEVALASIIIGKHKVTIIDALTKAEFEDANGNVIYGVLQDGADHSGTGEGTDVYVKFAVDIAGTPTAYTWTSNDPSSILMYLPYRKRKSELLEYDERRYLVAGIVGDAELSEDIAEIRGGLGLGDGEAAGDWSWTNTTAYYPLQNDPATIEDAINALNDEIGDRQYSSNNYIVDGETITESLDKLDQALASSGIKAKIIERVATTIPRGTAHTIPFTAGSGVNVYNPTSISTYKLDNTYFTGLYLEIYVGGKRLVCDSSAAAQDGEYEETSTSSFTPRFTIPAGQIIEYVIKDN